MTAGASNGVVVVDAGAIGFQAISRRKGAADVTGVGVDLGFGRRTIKVVEVDLIRAGVAADAISFVAEDAGVVVALGVLFAMEAVGVVEAGANFAAVEDVIAAVAAHAIVADGDVVVADPIFAAAEVAFAAVAADAISTAGEGAADVVDADAGVVSARSAANVDRSVR